MHLEHARSESANMFTKLEDDKRTVKRTSQKRNLYAITEVLL
jgi:hypothetical protein